jgi:hypothetical protein
LDPRTCPERPKNGAHFLYISRNAKIDLASGSLLSSKP